MTADDETIIVNVKARAVDRVFAVHRISALRANKLRVNEKGFRRKKPTELEKKIQALESCARENNCRKVHFERRAVGGK
ncbi:hypothetical protein ZHAS_00008386 [Anopheles sinensis]|uniref:Uncharacterized protein n=1 Tax=Anopheles sinensis TaxID=74873 RepID=A0A084VSB7_ANOSI|nr:hypothetical protein ZHAS_00008386 [Anopheles sinensis]